MWSTGALLQFCLIWSLNKEVNVCWDAFWIRVYHHSFHWRIPKSRINNLNSSLEGLYLYIFQNNIKKCWKGDPERLKALIMKNIAGIANAVQSRPTSDCQWLTLGVSQFVKVNCATKSQNHYITPNVLVYVFVVCLFLVFLLVMQCLLILPICCQKGNLGLHQLCSALKTLKSKRQSLTHWLTRPPMEL